MRLVNRFRGLCLLVITLLALTSVDVTFARPQPPTLPFGGDLDAALDTGRDEGKPVIVAFVAAWCPICTEMKAGSFRDPELLERAGEALWVLIDIDRDWSVARKRGIQAVPTLQFIDRHGETVDTLAGRRTADEIRHRLDALRAGTPIDIDDEDRPQSGLIWSPSGYRGTGICFSHVGYGPLSTYAQSAFQALRMGIRPRTPSTLGRGQFNLRGAGTWSNFWAIDGELHDPDSRFTLDFETLQTSVALAYGVTDQFELELELQNRSRFGGALDGLSQGFHDLFGIDQNGRDEVDRGRFVFHLDPGDGSAPISLGPSDRGSFSRTVQLTAQHNVSCGSRRLPAISYAVSARHETLDSDLSGGRNLDLGLSVALARRFGRFYSYGTVGYAWFGRDRFRGIKLTDTQWTLLLAGEWRLQPRIALLVQLLSTEGLLTDLDPFSKRSDEVTLGLKWELRDRGVLEFGVIENFISFDNTPDVGFHAGFSQRF